MQGISSTATNRPPPQKPKRKAQRKKSQRPQLRGVSMRVKKVRSARSRRDVWRQTSGRDIRVSVVPRAAVGTVGGVKVAISVESQPRRIVQSRNESAERPGRCSFVNRPGRTIGDKKVSLQIKGQAEGIHRLPREVGGRSLRRDAPWRVAARRSGSQQISRPNQKRDRLAVEADLRRPTVQLRCSTDAAGRAQFPGIAGSERCPDIDSP